ncbi:hypothetical protein BOC57_11285 [Burkholderia pseudomallei]|nr:hypothetical protein BOC57_11285 [Burkholderia pseudomallei]
MTTERKGSGRAPIKFDRPPVYEVACGVTFSGTSPVTTAHVGAYWQQVREAFPIVEDAAPIQNVIEHTGSGGGTVPFFEFFSSLPPLRRAWLFSQDRRNLIQLQQDRFLFNWKRSSDGDAYPSYDVVIEQFLKHLEGFRSFCRGAGIGEFTFRQYELVYVNHISNSNGLQETGLEGLLVDHVRSSTPDRFLPEAEGANWTTRYLLPDGLGRLHVTAQTAITVPAQEEVVRLDLTARGMTPDSTGGICANGLTWRTSGSRRGLRI